jgi:hypothetical protein
MFRRLVVTVLGAALGMAFIISPATAGSTVTKMRFELGDHEVAAGSSLSGSVSLWAKSASSWMPVGGAALSVVVDGTEVGTLTTDEDGFALVSWPASVAEGGHVMKVVYAGDGVYSRAQRAQGFSVTAAAPTSGTVPEAPFLGNAVGVAGSGLITITWEPRGDGGSPITGYNVYRGTWFGNETFLTSVAATPTSYVDSVVSGETFFYYVTAVNANGESAASNELSAAG